MTPRKSSFVNLLKGKGWNTDDLKSMDGANDGDYAFDHTLDHPENGC
jgi:hypothetical protein